MRATDAPVPIGNTWKNAVRAVTHAAIRHGVLRPQQCEVCGRTTQIHAHHEDYTDPLRITWLCRWCHVDRHRPGRKPPPTAAQPARTTTPPLDLHVYTVHGETYEALMRDLRAQIHERAGVIGYERAAEMLGISTTTLWRMSRDRHAR